MWGTRAREGGNKLLTMPTGAGGADTMERASQGALMRDAAAEVQAQVRSEDGKLNGEG